MRAIVAAALACLSACSGAAAPALDQDGGAVDLVVPSPVDLPPAGECVMVLRDTTADTCVIEWSCLEAGVLVLGCGPQDGGLTCQCGGEDQAGTPVGGAPASCAEADVAAFARTACGWSFL